MKRFIFISYSSKDLVRVDKLIDALKREGFNPWVDREGLQAGTTWRGRLHTQVESCDAYLVIISRNSKKSKWVQEELDVAQSLNKPIFPLRLDDSEPFFGTRTIQYEDIRRGKLPSEAFYERLAEVTPRKKRRRGKADRTNHAKKQVMEGAAELLSYYGEELSIKGKDFIAMAGKRLADLKDAVENNSMVKNFPANVQKIAGSQKKTTPVTKKGKTMPKKEKTIPKKKGK